MPLLTHIARANDGTLLVRPPRFTYDARMIHLSYLSSPHPSRSSFLDCALLPSLTRFLKVASTEHTVDGTDLEPYKRRAKNTLLRELGDAPHGSKFSIETPPYVFQYVQWSSAARRSCCCDVIPPHREATWPTCGTPSSPHPRRAPCIGESPRPGGTVQPRGRVLLATSSASSFTSTRHTHTIPIPRNDATCHPCACSP